MPLELCEKFRTDFSVLAAAPELGAVLAEQLLGDAAHRAPAEHRRRRRQSARNTARHSGTFQRCPAIAPSRVGDSSSRRNKMLRGLAAASAATRNPLSIAPTASMQKAVTMLSRFNVGSLLVAPRGDPSGAVGILTEPHILMSLTSQWSRRWAT